MPTHQSAIRRVVLCLIALTLTLNCGGSTDEPTPRATDEPTPRPTPIPTQNPLATKKPLSSITSILSKVGLPVTCDGIAQHPFSDAPAFDAESQPHQILFLAERPIPDSEDVTDSILENEPAPNDDASFQWQPATLLQTDLILCKQFEPTLIDSCDYFIGFSAKTEALPLYRADHSLILIEAHSGTRIGRTTLTGNTNGCPESTTSENYVMTYWTDIPDSKIVDVVTGFLADYEPQ